MAETPESKPPFWSSLPGIFTGLGGFVVAVTGLITALYSTGVIGSKDNPNPVPPVNTAVTLASSTAASPSPTPADNDRYKALTGKWRVIEQQAENFGGAEITWDFDATVSGNVLTLKGRILAIDGDKNLDADEENIRSTYLTTLMGPAGVGEFKKTERGVTTSYPATIRLDDDPTKFHGTIDVKGRQACSLEGRKQM
jgi:hypothetical protein